MIDILPSLIISTINTIIFHFTTTMLLLCRRYCNDYTTHNFLATKPIFQKLRHDTRQTLGSLIFFSDSPAPPELDPGEEKRNVGGKREKEKKGGRREKEKKKREEGGGERGNYD